MVTVEQLAQTLKALQLRQFSMPQKVHRPLLKVNEVKQAVQLLGSVLQVAQLFTRQLTQSPFTSPKPGLQEVQIPMLEQVAQLRTLQEVHSVVLDRKKPKLQLTH